MRRNGVSPAHGHQMHELGSIDVMRLDQTRHVACASSCMSMRTSLEEGVKTHRFAGILPEQSLTEAGRHCVWSFPAPVGDAVHLPAFFPKFRISSTFSSILLRTTSKASF